MSSDIPRLGIPPITSFGIAKVDVTTRATDEGRHVHAVVPSALAKVLKFMVPNCGLTNKNDGLTIKSWGVNRQK